MSEKRFKLDYDISDNDAIFIDDIIEDKSYTIYNDRFKEMWLQQVVDLLNEQQATIEQLKSVLRNECNIINDEDLLEYVKINGVSLNE